jgi:hypothetical protein
MQRILTTVVALVLVLTTSLNIFLVVQNQQLRRQLATQMSAAAVTSPSAEQEEKIQQLTADLEKYKKDFIKATRDANTLREQATSNGSAAQERDTLKAQVTTLQQENQGLRNEVQNLQTMNGINGQVTELRGLAPRSSVPREFMNQAQLREHFTHEYDRRYSAEEEQRDLAVLRALDMDSGGGSLRDEQIDSLTKSVLGFYDQETKQLVVVTEKPSMTVHDRVTYAHEFTHSLQDQHYNLTNLFKRAENNSDYDMAIRALVEGDATLTMSLYSQKHLDAMDIASYKLETIEQMDLTGMFGGRRGPMVESAAYFPYQEGLTFVASLYGYGDWAEVERAFQNPPRSTEQVLHPEKFFTGDEPVAVRLPNVAGGLGNGWATLLDDTLGELYIRIYLEHKLSFDTAIPAGEGWGGDHYQVLRDEQGRLALALQSAWDTTNDAEEFFQAYSAFVVRTGGGNPAVLELSPSRMRWQLADRQFYLSRAGSQVLVLHAPDGATLDRMIAQFPGF